MHDIRAIRAEPDAFDAALARRRLPPAAAELLALDSARREAVSAAQALQASRNTLSKQIGEMRRRGEDTAELERQSAEAASELEARNTTAKSLERELQDRLAVLPNVLDDSVPDGADETANVVVKQVGEPPAATFARREHFELGETAGLMDFATAAKMAGARFTILFGALARLERALAQFMLELHVSEHGYTETVVPLLVNEAAAYGTDKLPKFEADLFKTTDGRYLIPTAEVPLTSTVMGDIVPDSRLPIRLTALSECFRSEAGSAGRDTRGMLRQHQFRKVELVSITRPEESWDEHERMTRCAETVLERLALPYRRMLLCSGDTGFGAAKTYDLEVWLPGQQAWREISSCSNTRDFQARRMNARFRGTDGKVAYVHTLNGSGVAVGRALIAVMENYQQPDGSIAVPEALRPWMGGVNTIGG